MFMDIKLDIDTTEFREVSEYVSRASGRELPKWKAIVGDKYVCS